MISTLDISDIFFNLAKSLGIADMYHLGNVPKGDVTDERVVIHTHQKAMETYMQKCFLNVYVLVPDIDELGHRDIPRLTELEHLCEECFKSGGGTYNDTSYVYEMDEIGIEREEDLRCHSVNVRILFSQLNVM